MRNLRSLIPIILFTFTLFGLVACETTQSGSKRDVNFENFLEQSAMHNHTEYGLGLKYISGQGGVLQDYARAAYWFRRAAERGEAPAQVELALIYEKGMGVPQNNILAHMWFNLAALQGRLAGGSIAEEAKSQRDSVAKLMTPTEIAKAENLAREWVPDLDWLQPSEYGIK